MEANMPSHDPFVPIHNNAGIRKVIITMKAIYRKFMVVLDTFGTSCLIIPLSLFFTFETVLMNSNYRQKKTGILPVFDVSDHAWNCCVQVEPLLLGRYKPLHYLRQLELLQIRQQSILPYQNKWQYLQLHKFQGYWFPF